MSACLGGFTITAMGWLGPRAVFVDLATTYTNRLYQLYAGKTLIGVTSAATETRVIGQLDPSKSPQPILLLAVLPADRLTDFGQQLPPRPWNRFDLTWPGAGQPADTKEFIITAGTTVGGAVDDSNEIARLPFNGAALDYELKTPSVNPGGVWNYGVRPIDSTLPNGNAGTRADVGLTAFIHPPDIAQNGGGQRLSAVVAAGIAVVSFAYNW